MTYICPYCSGKRIMCLRIDSDWGSGVGDYYPVNDEDIYTEEDLELDSYSRPDIELLHCLECEHMWEEN